MDKVIMHSDANSFYASVEAALDPSLRGKPVAVCGDPQRRHGIVLAKSEPAKKAGVKTGMANWQARALCPGLIIVPPQYEWYLRYSAFLKEIYSRYTDRIEPFGLDECWLDVSGAGREPGALADEIRTAVREELGITVSIGVSFNKVFAKLGSDMKKPDAVTLITPENYREKVWPLPCSDLLFCGPATTRKLRTIGVHTIGELAALPEPLIREQLGKNGRMLWLCARGEGETTVAMQDAQTEAKSLGHGITCASNVENFEQAHKVIVALTQDIGYKLRLSGMKAGGVSLTVRDSELSFQSWQKRFERPTQDESILIGAADGLLRGGYHWMQPLRMLTVSAIYLSGADRPEQQSLFVDYKAEEKRERLHEGIDRIRGRYGMNAVLPASLLDEDRISAEPGFSALPGSHNRMPDRLLPGELNDKK